MASTRRYVFTGSPYEKKIGVSRAVRDGRFVAVTGTAPLGPDGKTIGKGDAVARRGAASKLSRPLLNS